MNQGNGVPVSEVRAIPTEVHTPASGRSLRSLWPDECPSRPVTGSTKSRTTWSSVTTSALYPHWEGPVPRCSWSTGALVGSALVELPGGECADHAGAAFAH
jgi:hypothetical protein